MTHHRILAIEDACDLPSTHNPPTLLARADEVIE
jgi:hypothetical protein